MPSHHEDTQHHATDGLRPISDVLDEVLERIEQDRARPLVKLQERLPDGRVAVELFDRERGDSPQYDFYCRDPRQALEFVRQLAGKRWVTKRHLEIFASLMLHAFPESTGGMSAADIDRSAETVEAVRLEKDSCELFVEFLRDNRQALRRVAHWGDGKCGYLIAILKDELLGGQP